ncbi:hypothetical protein LCGC14_0378180 [marine sediment metagenome]|uniref:Uncharacterized protein n=1 Tax=marine sediment metagenome TaxID=412755 RepID=A0A0F9T332_9ZZZZ
MAKLLSRTAGKLIVPFLALVLIAMFSAGCFQELLAPAYIEPDAIKYAGEEETGGKSLNPFWTTLWDSKRIARQMEYQHGLVIKGLVRQIEDDADAYNYILSQHVLNIQSAEDFKSILFSPTGPIGLLVPTLAAFGIGAMGVTRPKDKRKLKDRDKTIVGLEKTAVAVTNNAVTETTTVS